MESRIKKLTGKIPTEQEIIARLEKVSNYDKESAHIEADDILCDLLKSLGYGKVVEAYDAIYKWYA